MASRERTRGPRGRSLYVLGNEFRARRRRGETEKPIEHSDSQGAHELYVVVVEMKSIRADIRAVRAICRKEQLGETLLVDTFGMPLSGQLDHLDLCPVLDHRAVQQLLEYR